MRYLFRGIIRENGRAVEGHVEATSEDDAFNILANNGIVTEGMRPDPRPQAADAPAETSGAMPELAEAIDSALDSSASQVRFDDLADKFKGKNVWVIDREKIRHRVAQVVDSALQQVGEAGAAGPEPMKEIRDKVAEAIQGLFQDNRNIASQQSGQQVAMEHQVQRMAHLVRQAEATLAAIQAAVRTGGFGGGGGGGVPKRMMFHAPDHRNDQREVLLEIFKANMEMQRGIKMQGEESPAGPGEAAPPPAAG